MDCSVFYEAIKRLFVPPEIITVRHHPTHVVMMQCDVLAGPAAAGVGDGAGRQLRRHFCFQVRRACMTNVMLIRLISATATGTGEGM